MDLEDAQWGYIQSKEFRTAKWPQFLGQGKHERDLSLHMQGQNQKLRESGKLALQEVPGQERSPPPFNL